MINQQVKKPLTKEEKDRKIQSYLATLEKHFEMDDRYQHYQKRFYRVNRALNSIKQHFNCYVSDFSDSDRATCEGDQRSENPEEHDVDEILEMLDKEIPLSPTKLKEQSDLSTPVRDASTSSGKDSKRLSKLFLKIELKLKSYLKEQELERRDSSKSQKSFRSNDSVLPRLMRNFFDEKDKVRAQVSAQMKKRKSVFDSTDLRAFKDSCSFKSSIKEQYPRSQKQEFKSFDQVKFVSNFDIGNLVMEKEPEIDLEELNSDEIEEPVYFEQFKRNSIFNNLPQNQMKEIVEKVEEMEFEEDN